MALLGLGGRGLRERLIRQYGILPPGSIGQTLFDEIIPVVLVDDLTTGLVLDQFYRAPAMGRANQSGVALNTAFAEINARSGVLCLVERIEWRTETATGLRLKVGASPTDTGGHTKEWRDRRIAGDPATALGQGTELNQSGSTVAEMQGTPLEFRSMELQMVLDPLGGALGSNLTLWSSTIDDDLDVNWFWKEIILP